MFLKFNTWIITILFSASLLGQNIDLKNYEPLLCQGEAPKAFKESLDEKSGKLRLKDRQIDAATMIKMAAFINDLLSSGRVLYGTDLNTRVDKIASNILSKNPDLKNISKDLHFYIIRSQSVNAIATPYGLIFVTTGLLATVNSDDELAYVLCHEISHYYLRHSFNIIKYQEQIKNEKSESLESQIKRVYAFSRFNEFEADSLGFKFYKNCKYDINAPWQIMSVIESQPFQSEKILFSDLSKFDYGNLRDKFKELLMNEDTVFTIPDQVVDTSEMDESTHPDLKERLKRIATYANMTEFPARHEDLSYEKKLALYEYVYTLIQNTDYAGAWCYATVLARKTGNTPFLSKVKAYSMYRCIGEDFPTSINLTNTATDLLKMGTTNVLYLAFSEWMNTTNDSEAASAFDIDLQDRMYHRLKWELSDDESDRSKLMLDEISKRFTDTLGKPKSEKEGNTYLLPYKLKRRNKKRLLIGYDFKGTDTIISILPKVTEVSLMRKVKRLYLREDKTNVNMKSALEFAYSRNQMHGHIIDNGIGINLQTEDYNDYIVVNLWFEELLGNENAESELLFNKQYIGKVTSKYNSDFIHVSKAALILDRRNVSTFAIHPITWPFLLIWYTIPQKNSYFVDFIVNTKENRVEMIRYEEFTHKMSQDVIQSEAYNLMYHTRRGYEN